MLDFLYELYCFNMLSIRVRILFEVTTKHTNHSLYTLACQVERINKHNNSKDYSLSQKVNTLLVIQKVPELHGT